jgi:hypothetical protein
MADKNKNPFNREKLYLLGAATVLGILIIAGESSLLFSQDSVFGKLTDKTYTQAETEEDDDSGLDEDGEDDDDTQEKNKSPYTGEAGLKPLFTDIAVDSPYMEALRYLYEENIMKGYPDGSFQPDKTVNRAELLKVIIVALGEPKNINEHKKCFTDVNEEWFAPYGCYAKWKGWVKGYGDGGFHPSNDVTRVEALKMMLEAYGIDLVNAPMEGSDFTELSADDWYSTYVWTTEKNGYAANWKDFTSANLENKLTRLEVATAIYILDTAGSQTPTI